MLPRVFQTPFLELEEHPSSIPIEIIPPRVVPTQSDFDNGRIARETGHSRFALHTDVVRFDARYRTQQQ